MMRILLLCCIVNGAICLPSGIQFPGLEDEKGIQFPGSEDDETDVEDESLKSHNFIRFLGSQNDIPMSDFSPLVQDFIEFLEGNATLEEGIAIAQDDSLAEDSIENKDQILHMHGWSRPSYGKPTRGWRKKPWYKWWKKFGGKPGYRPVSSKPWWKKPTTKRPSSVKPWWKKPTTSKPWWKNPTSKSPASVKPWWNKPSTPKPSTTKPWWTKPTTQKSPTTLRPIRPKPTSVIPTPTSNPNSPATGFNGKIVGLYLLLSDETIKEYTSHVNWQPKLHRHQQTGSNVLFFTFIHPEEMIVPISFKNLAATRGTNQEGAIPQSTKIIFAIGGIGYSLSVNPWDWLTSKSKAEAMAIKVARWKKMYNIDGIDLDIENGAGDRPEAGKNMIHFIKKVKEIEPSMIISQPTFGFPQIPANNEVINAGWSKNGRSTGLIDSVGIMVYQGTQSLRYVDNYTNRKHSSITARVPSNKMLLGVEGCASSSSLEELAKACLDQDLGGIMVWASSVRKGEGDGLKYGCTAKDGDDTARGLHRAMRMFNPR